MEYRLLAKNDHSRRSSRVLGANLFKSGLMPVKNERKRKKVIRGLIYLYKFIDSSPLSRFVIINVDHIFT